MSKITRRFSEYVLKLLGLFVILEPIWMLLPFAGFLYGSCFHIQTLSRHPETAWLTHFVFPVLTMWIVGPLLVIVGFLTFLVGAGQIYWSKFSRKGLVTNGLYSYVRHPQYTALVLFGIGVLFTWGRAITFLVFFIMMFLYYHLAKIEEKKCSQLFGEDYEEYRKSTSFCLPGDNILNSLGKRLSLINLPKPLQVFTSFVLTVIIALGLIQMIKTIRVQIRHVPFTSSTVQFKQQEPPDNMKIYEGRAKSMPYVCTDRILIARGPWRNAVAPGFAENVLSRLLHSPSLAEFLCFLNEPSREAAIVFIGPFTPPEKGLVGKMFLPKNSSRRGPEPDPDGPDRARLIIMRCKLLDRASLIDSITDKSKRKIIKMCVVKVDLSRPKQGDFVLEGPFTTGPVSPGEDRFNWLVGRLKEREALLPKPSEEPMRPISKSSSKSDVVLVHAPILKTRLDPLFARDTLDRLINSPSFINRIQAFGAGGNRIAVIFPRPGPNWYSTYHFHYHQDKDGNIYTHGHTNERPQVSAFVMLVNKNSDMSIEDMFKDSYRTRRKILGAFIAELDFGIKPPTDPVYEVVIIGARRDLEERWDFFLSGL